MKKFLLFLFSTSYLFAIVGINDIPKYMFFEGKVWKDKTVLYLRDSRIFGAVNHDLYHMARRPGKKQVWKNKLFIGTGYVGPNSPTLPGLFAPKRALLVYVTFADVDCQIADNINWQDTSWPPSCKCSTDILNATNVNCLKYNYDTCSCACDRQTHDYVDVGNQKQCMPKCKENQVRDASGKCILKSLSSHLKTPDYCKSYTGSYVIPYTNSFHEDMSLAGSDLTLHYASTYTQGFVESDINATKKLLAVGWNIHVHHRLFNTTLYKGDGEVIKDVNITSKNSNFIVKDKNLEYIFDSSYNHIKTQEQLSKTALYSFTYTNDKLSSVTDLNNKTINLNYNENTLKSIATDVGQITKIDINASTNTLTSVEYSNGQKYRFIYNEKGLMNEKYDPKGNKYRYGYRKDGTIKFVIRPQKSLMTYTKIGQNYKYQNTSVLGFFENNIPITTLYKNYKAKDGIRYSTVAYPRGNVKEVFVNVNGKKRKTTFCGTTSIEEYNAFHPKTNEPLLTKLTQTMPSGLTKNTTYQTSFSNSQEVAQTTVSNDTTTITTNYSNHTKTIKSPLGETHKLDYDTKMINITRYTPPHTWTIHYNYDSKGNLTHKWQGFRHTYYSYDEHGNLISKRTNLLDTTKYTYDPSNRLTSIKYPDNSEIKYEYDLNNNITRLYTPSSFLHTLNYNAINKRDSWQNLQGYKTLYTYNAQQKPTKITKPSGKSLTFTYDKGELKSIYDGVHTSTINYTCENKPTSIASTSGEAIHYTYDGDLLTSQSYKGVLDKNISLTYNNKFLPSSIEYANTKENIAYDKDDRIISINNTQILYNKNNQTLKDNNFTSFTKADNYGELKTIEDKSGNKTIYKQEILQRDNKGRITRVKETTSKDAYIYTYTYDNKGQLTHSTQELEGKIIIIPFDGLVIPIVKKGAVYKEEYTYDKEGNQVGTKTTTNNQTTQTTSTFINNSLETIGDTSYIYDNDGCLQTKIAPQGTTYYTYGIHGELKKVQSQAKTIEYLHNIHNQRVAKKIDNQIVEKYLWKDLTALLAIYDKDNTLITRYFYANKQTPYKIIHNNKTYYPNYNHQGSLRALTDINGNIVKEITYSPYGKILNDTNQSIHVHKTFANGLYDKDTNLIRFGKRDYDPNTKRWTAKDPIDFSGGDTNLYRYVSNDPVNYVDPRGEVAWFVPVALFFTLGHEYLNAPDVNEEPKSGTTVTSLVAGMCIPIGKVVKNIDIYGPSGGRIFQLSYKKNPFFRLDRHNLNEKITKIKESGNRKTLHYHRYPDMKKHRPFEGW